MKTLCQVDREMLTMSDPNILTHRLFQVDPSRDSTAKSKHAWDTIDQSHVDEIQRGLFRQYAVETLRFQLALHAKVLGVVEDTTHTKERRYFASTLTRRAFKKLMCLCKLEANPITTVDIGAVLAISHKAASDLVKDAKGFDTIQETIINKRKRYVARCWWVDTFINNGAMWNFKNGEKLVRSRMLYNEFARANDLKAVGAPKQQHQT